MAIRISPSQRNTDTWKCRPPLPPPNSKIEQNITVCKFLCYILCIIKIFPTFLSIDETTPASGSGPCSTWETWKESGHKNDWRDWSTSLMRRGWEIQDCSALRRGGSVVILSIFLNTWREGAKKMELGTNCSTRGSA